jgi:RNA polymerase sigma-70 factor (ECF subfamily)
MNRESGTVPAAPTVRQARRLLSALCALPPDLRLAVTLRDVAGLSYQEIAARTGLPVRLVRSRVNQARLLLYRSLRREGGDSLSSAANEFSAR